MGFGTTIMVYLTNVYYIIILAWTLHFFFNSFTDELPWASCGHSWNTEKCVAITGGNDATLMPNESSDSVAEYWE